LGGGIAPLGEQKSTWIFKQIELIAERFNFTLNTAINKIPKEALEIILHGGSEKFEVISKELGITRNYEIDFEGIANFIKNQFHETSSVSINYKIPIHYFSIIISNSTNTSTLVTHLVTNITMNSSKVFLL
jgi:excinuclease UvrABC ATPase subunit